ncbi:hypothetical protein J3459_017824 [Metarhizium acridum]|uniref:uncharacterized protein n=1 Tax=Metarhizium acridum TaxID=92637 RepID=UPI001C6C4536|nr:hypothetical protein J3459_017824 [Metarhizium acridum]KAG8410400.1 hypothetical protein J3458_017724 [Metarhizium acridum]
MHWNADELKEVKSRLSDLIRGHNAELQQLKKTGDLLAYVTPQNINIVENASSSAKLRRGKVERGTKMADEQKRLEQRILDLEVSSGRMWAKIGELQDRERALENAEKTKGHK